jgi:predicted lysophospholipase L1 biosynthesis ABC-type transport system permease subunit
MSGQCRVGLINQEAADLYFGGKPIGASVIDERGVRTSIVGVVMSKPFGMFQQHAEPTLYLPIWQDCPFRMTLILNTSGWSRRVMADLRRRIASVPGGDATPPLIRTMKDQLSQSAFAPLRIAALILCASASIALLLSVLGLVGAQSDAEHQRRRELALRIALGAQRWRIVYEILKPSGQAALWGNLIGFLFAFALLRVLKSDMALISAPPTRVWLLGAAVPLMIVVITSILPAHRASVIDPLTIMRDDH